MDHQDQVLRKVLFHSQCLSNILTKIWNHLFCKWGSLLYCILSRNHEDFLECIDVKMINVYSFKTDNFKMDTLSKLCPKFQGLSDSEMWRKLFSGSLLSQESSKVIWSSPHLCKFSNCGSKLYAVFTFSYGHLALYFWHCNLSLYSVFIKQSVSVCQQINW